MRIGGGGKRRGSSGALVGRLTLMEVRQEQAQASSSDSLGSPLLLPATDHGVLGVLDGSLGIL